MILVFKKETNIKEIETISNDIKKLGFKPHIIHGETKVVIGIVGDRDKSKLLALKSYTCVESLVPVSKPYKLAARSSKEESTIIGSPSVSNPLLPCT